MSEFGRKLSSEDLSGEMERLSFLRENSGDFGETRSVTECSPERQVFCGEHGAVTKGLKREAPSGVEADSGKSNGTTGTGGDGEQGKWRPSSVGDTEPGNGDLLPGGK